MKHSFSHSHLRTAIRIGLGMCALVLTVLAFFEPTLGGIALAQVTVLSNSDLLKRQVQELKSGSATNPNAFVRTGDPWVDVAHFIGNLVGPNVTFWKSWRDGSKRATGWINPTTMLSYYGIHPDDPTKTIVTVGSVKNAKGETVIAEYSGKPMFTFLGVEYRRFLDFFGGFRELLRISGKNAPEFTVRKNDNGRVSPTTIRFYDLQSDGTLGFIEADKAVGAVTNGVITDRLNLDIPRRGGYGYGGGNMGSDGLRAFANPNAGGEQQAMQSALGHDTSALQGMAL